LTYHIPFSDKDKFLCGAWENQFTRQHRPSYTANNDYEW